MTVFRPAEAQPVEMQDLVSFEFHDHVGVSALDFTGLHPWHLCLRCGSIIHARAGCFFCTVLGLGARIESLALRI